MEKNNPTSDFSHLNSLPTSNYLTSEPLVINWNRGYVSCQELTPIDIGLAAAVSVGVGVWLVYAAVSNWPFTLSGNYTVSDSDKVEVADGAAKLKAQASSQDTQSELSGASANVAGKFGCLFI